VVLHHGPEEDCARHHRPHTRPPLHHHRCRHG
jgi:hypothetical protein